MIDREEILAYLVAGYKAEMQRLSDVELLFLYKQQKKMEDMTPAQLEALAKDLERDFR